ESGQPHPESVTVDLLEAAVARTVDGVTRLAELTADPSGARTRTGKACTWCPLRAGCADGKAFLRSGHDLDLDLDGDEPDDW
ncbi:MAG TPA: hypothetical protein VMT43_13185, partial [Acidimicrobiales bacterium]|nr:hypothetical protein [Acidimicrobiales bacterium]